MSSIEATGMSAAIEQAGSRPAAGIVMRLAAGDGLSAEQGEASADHDAWVIIASAYVEAPRDRPVSLLACGARAHADERAGRTTRLQGAFGGCVMPASRAAHVWDAQPEIDVAALIGDYLLAHPPPPSSLAAGDLEDWAFNLLEDGTARRLGLDESGVS